MQPLLAAREGLRGAWAALRTQLPARLFLVVMALALLLRLARPDWYSNRMFHPDERWLFDKTAELSWPGEPGRNDPAGMQYGSLPLYSVAVVKDVMGLPPLRVGAHDAVVVAGRTVTGLVDSLGVLGTFLLGWILLGPWPALLASLVLACAPLSIQLSHFFTVDPWLATLAVLTLAACAQVAKRPSLGWSAFCGALYGGALACKSSGLPLVLSVLLAHLWSALAPGLTAKERRAGLIAAGQGLAVAAGAALGAFLVAMPWALLDFSKFLANQTAQRDILVTGSPAGVPFVRQYWDTTPLFHLRNIAQFYLGLPAGPLALCATLGAMLLGGRWAWRAWTLPAKAPRRGAAAAPGSSPAGLWRRAFFPALLLAWVLPYYLIVGFSFAKFARYMLPILPELALLLAWGLWLLKARWRRTQWALAALVLLGALGHGLGYGLTYTRPHPWIEASRWIYQNIPPQTDDSAAPGGKRQTAILNEDWGDDLPVEVDGQVLERYRNLKGGFDQVNIVEWDSPQKLSRLARSLSQADVLVLADPRAYATYLRLPTRFPLTHAYYDLLFSDPGRLGFKLAHEASNPVKVFGLELPDSRIPSVPRWRWADESFTLYDRPHTFLFTRVAPMGEEQLRGVLMDRVRELGLSTAWMGGAGPEELERQAQSGAFAPEPGTSQTQGPANPNLGLSRGALHPLLQPVLMWWILVTLLGWMALPLAARLLGHFPAGGYALSRSLGVLLFGWLAYNLAWLGVLPFTQGGLWLLLLLLALGLAAALRPHRESLKAWAQAQRQEILFTEGVFTAAFLFFCLVRAYNPNIHDIGGQGYFGGGEPLGMTYLSAVTRCATFPAYDPWLSGLNSSYYYFGYVLAAALTKLSGFPPSITYNLSLALFFSLTLVTAYGLLRALVARRWAALGGALMVAMAGSLWTVGFLAIQASRGFNVFAALFSHPFIWDPSRFPELVNGHIFEFPYFSYLYGDLHPHNMVLGFSLLLLGLLLVPFLNPDSGWRSVGGTPGRALTWLAVTALLLDVQYGLNTWSWPVFVAVALACMAIGPWAGKTMKPGAAWAAAGWGLGGWLAALGLGRVLMQGFRHYYLQNGGNRVGVVLPSEWQMSTYIPLAYFLPGLVALGLMAGGRLRAWGQAQAKPLGWERLRRRDALDRWMSLAERLLDKRPAFAILGGLLALLALGLLGWAALEYANQGVLSLALGLGVACVGVFLLGGWGGGEAFLWILGGFTCFLVAASEHWFVADRMNTIFKFWINGWVLMGVVFGAGFAGAFEAPGLAHAVKARAGSRRGAGKARPVPAWLAWAVGAGVVAWVFGAALVDAHFLPQGGRFVASFWALGLLILAALVLAAFQAQRHWWTPARRGLWGALLALGLLYPLGATVQRIREASGFRHPHLDGLAFMGQLDARPGFDVRDYDRHDYALIQWLNQHADVTEALLEVPGLELYKGYSRFAIYTGLPTLLGWDYQVGQQLGERTGGILEQRKRDAQIMYGPDDAAAVALLKQYRVRWVVVGSLERQTYAAAGLDKFSHLATVAAQDGPSVLYRFDWDKP